MDQIILFFTRMVTLVVGVFFFLCMLFIGAIGAIFLLLKLFWYRITGKATTERVNVKFWRFEQNSPKPSQRPMEDVTDVEVKEIVRPEDMKDSDR